MQCIGGICMIIDIGYRIKYYRKSKNMTQRELSRGIISISYLSKIENGAAAPPVEVLEFLLNRLEVNLDLEPNQINEETCNEWFLSLFNKELEKSLSLYKQIKDKKKYISDVHLLNLLTIHKIRYFLIHKEINKASVTIEKLRKMESKFSNSAKYYWLKFQAYYHFSNSVYSKALEYYLKAKKYEKHSTYLIDEEKYDLHYMTALSASYLKKTYIVYKHGNKALTYYQRRLHLKEAAQCHTLLGIAGVGTKDYEDALENFKLAQKIAKTINNNSLLGTSLQNIGNLYSITNKSNEAINYYKKSYKLRDRNSKKIIPINSLMKEYYKNGDFKNAKIWLQAGLDIITTLDSVSKYTYEVQVYDQLINGMKPNAFEKLLLNDVLPYLTAKDLHKEKTPYLEILAKYYFDQRKYKRSAIYYQEALKIK